MPLKYPMWYGELDRSNRNDALFVTGIVGGVTVVLLVGSVGVLLAPPEPHQGVAAAIFGIGAVVFSWLTYRSAKTALKAHRRLRERINGWKRS